MQILQIYVFGPAEEGFLDLTPGTTLDVESLAAAFDENFSVGDFSLPLTIPWTNNNRRLLGFAERLRNQNKQSYYKCTVYDTGLPVMINAKMTMLEKKGDFKYTKGSFNVSIAGTKGLYGTQIRNLYVKNLALGGPISFSGMSSRQFAEGVMKGTITGYPYLAFAPVAIENFFDTQRPDWTTEFLALDCVNNIIVTGTGPNDWTFARPQSSNPTVAVAPGNEEYVDYRTVPFFQLKFVLQHCFSEFGYTLTGDFITSTDWDDVYIFSNCGVEKYSNAYTDFNEQILPGDHMPPKLFITDFLKGVFAFFNMYPIFDGSNTVTLQYRRDDFKNKKILSLNNIIADEFDSSFVNQFNTDGTTDDFSNFETGYVLNYTWDANDQYYSDQVKDWLGDATQQPEKNIVGTVATRAALDSFTYTRSLTTNDIVFVLAENIYYSVADATTTPILWDVYAERLNSYNKYPSSRSVDCLISTLCSYAQLSATTLLVNPATGTPVLTTGTGVVEKKNFVGTRQAGSYINNKGIKVVSPWDLRIFFIKKIPVGGVNLPISTNYNRAIDNTVIFKYSLAWQGEDGIALNFHTKWQDMQEKLEVVKTSVKVNQKVLNDLANANVVEVNGVQFFPYKTDRQIPLQQSMDIYLTPL